MRPERVMAVSVANGEEREQQRGLFLLDVAGLLVLKSFGQGIGSVAPGHKLALRVAAESVEEVACGAAAHFDHFAGVCVVGKTTLAGGNGPAGGTAALGGVLRREEHRARIERLVDRGIERAEIRRAVFLRIHVFQPRAIVVPIECDGGGRRRGGRGY